MRKSVTGKNLASAMTVLNDSLRGATYLILMSNPTVSAVKTQQRWSHQHFLQFIFP